ncbi:hypothetical protein PISMIDRAFT_502978 [Pisolithus microcarpus 441]|uniref:Uncharacterized protein n=1 Tax=Pisolithus microcarpus 441 TaxID=765257 RepID=A0A0C9XGB2_9AGAM|nr:hypothetical protein PISMIDRAFT_502978 [Pisolithus microcarpus 441]
MNIRYLFELSAMAGAHTKLTWYCYASRCRVTLMELHTVPIDSHQGSRHAGFPGGARCYPRRLIAVFLGVAISVANHHSRSREYRSTHCSN